jgi:hypothetical protein
MADNDAPDQGGTTEPQNNTPDNSDEPRDQTHPGHDADDQGQDQREPDQKNTGKTFTQADVDKLIADRVARERKKYAGHDDLKRKASEFDKLEDAKKSEAQKLNDQLAAAQVELQGYRVAEIRRNAAVEAGLDQRHAEFITAADAEQALEQAKRLAEAFKPATTQPGRPDLKQGARPQAQQTMSRDDLLRGLAGYRR